MSGVGASVKLGDKLNVKLSDKEERVPERVELWWARRRWSKGRDIPYRIGRFRSEWERYPALIRQYHPDLNGGITLTQIPPAADVYLLWQCDTGHRFVATPIEQRLRPGHARRRSIWCPECTALAVPTRTIDRHSTPTKNQVAGEPRGRNSTAATVRPPPQNVGQRGIGEAFISARAPSTASAAEADLRARLAARLNTDFTVNAVRVNQPFFDRFEVWPDIVIAELRVAIEYDTIGRHGLEHVGGREKTDRHKDRLLRQSGWEIIRIRCGALRPLGPHDIRVSGVSSKTIDTILEELRRIRGDLIVNCYLT